MEQRVKIKLAMSNQRWANQAEVVEQLYSIPNTDDVVIDVLNEGISLSHYGVKTVLDQWVIDTSRDPNTVKIDTPNQYENIGYPFFRKIRKSHFFKKSLIRYSADLQPVVPAEKLYGYFVGKYTEDRNRIAQEILQYWPAEFLMSVMICDEISNHWDPRVYAIGSLDNHAMADQLALKHNTNQSLLQFYNQFEIELVSETFIYGKTFFPTEKTVRPIMGSKPFLINGPKNFLENLKNLGFETFEEVWSEEYDQYEGIERWEHIKKTIDYIKYGGYNRTIAQRIVTYNYNHLRNIMEYGSTLY
jgi:hypothetical protein